MASALQIDARVLAAIEDLPLLARVVVEGFLEGLHRSPFLGYSSEFSAYRAYTQGDNLRHVDWKVWGRTDELYVKQFEDDTNLRGHIFLDTSASMDFGEGVCNKFDYARVLASVLAELMVRQHDAPGLVLFGSKAQLALPTQTSRHHADEIFQLLSRAHAIGGTLIDPTLYRIVDGFSRRGIAVVISDLFTAGGAILDLLRQLNAQRQETIVFHLLSPEEMDLPYDGECLFEDSETGEELPVHAEAFRADYQSRLADFCASIQQECTNLETDYHRIRTDMPLDAALIAYLERRTAT
jgi:uncharacterized protein (DUF58 family)